MDNSVNTEKLKDSHSITFNDEESLEQKIELITGKVNPTINLDIGGKYFKVKLSTLKNINDNLILETYNKNENKTDEIFFDRSYLYFPIILEYLKTKTFNIKIHKRHDLFYIGKEAEFYNLKELNEIIKSIPNEISIINFEASPRYQNFGTHTLESLNDESLQGGFCLNSPYWIIFELNYEYAITSLKIAGFSPDRARWAPSNGSNAKVYTSLDKVTWKEVGKLPSNYGNTILPVILTKSEGKYLKIQHTTYLGISYLKINPE